MVSILSTLPTQSRARQGLFLQDTIVGSHPFRGNTGRSV